MGVARYRVYYALCPRSPRNFFDGGTLAHTLAHAWYIGGERAPWLLALVFVCLLYWRLYRALKDLSFQRQPPQVPDATVCQPPQLPRGGQLLRYTNALDHPLDGARWDLMERKSTSSGIERLIRILSTGKTFTPGEQFVFELERSKGKLSRCATYYTHTPAFALWARRQRYVLLLCT